MSFLRQHKFMLSFLLLLAFSSVMVLRQYQLRQSRHVELREALILLHTGGYTNEADIVYRRLLRDVDHLPTRDLLDDWQRTVVIVDPNSQQPESPIWKYHWVIRKQMERRSADVIVRARKLAEEHD